MVAIMLGADNGFFYVCRVMHFSRPFSVFLIYHKQFFVHSKKNELCGINIEKLHVCVVLIGIILELC